MHLSNSKSWRCENEGFVRCFLQIWKIEDMKTQLSCDASFKFENLKMWKTKLLCDASFKFEKWKIWKQSFRAMPPSNLKSGRCENEALVRCLLQIWKVEDVQTKLSCDVSFKFEKWKIWKQSFRAMFPSNLKSWRYENEACVRCLLQIWTVEDVKTQLSCDVSFKFENLKMWKRSFCAMTPSNLKCWRYENEAFVRCILQIPKVEDVKSKLWCDASFKFEKWKMWKPRFRAMFPSNLKSWRYENDAFVRCLL